MAARSRTDERLAGIPLFAACSPKELGQIAQLTTAVRVEAGKVLAEEGRLGLEFVIIVSGEASVRRGGRELARLGPGDYFGEIALLDEHHTRTASVVADSDMEIEVVDRREFAQLLDDHPTICRGLLTGLASIVTDTLDR